jgi:hypothetical protein
MPRDRPKWHCRTLRELNPMGITTRGPIPRPLWKTQGILVIPGRRPQ